METKQQIIERLFKADLISFKEAMILSQDLVSFPALNVSDSLNDVFNLGKPGSVFNENSNQTND